MTDDPIDRTGASDRHGLSVAVITLNEEPRIRKCLESVAWAREIVVVDAESTDRTVEFARSFTSKVIVRPWEGFAAQKNFALAQTTQPWVLSLDADEQVTDELHREIQAVLKTDGPLDGYYVPRKNFFLGRWIRHGKLFPDYQLRLFRRGKARFRTVGVHESAVVHGRTGYLPSPLLHWTYRSIEEFVERSNRYSTLAAQELIHRGRRVSPLDLLLRPLGRFLSMYFLHRGFLDGGHGLVIAVLYGYYVFLRTAKVLELRGEQQG